MSKPLTDEYLWQVRERRKRTDAEMGAEMLSGCSDYACYCHADLPKLLNEIQRLKEELATTKQLSAAFEDLADERKEEIQRLREENERLGKIIGDALIETHKEMP